MQYLLLALLNIPLICSWYYGGQLNLPWFLFAGVCQLVVMIAVLRLSTLIKHKTSSALFVASTALLFASFQIARLVSFYLQGESFNTRFFFHANLNNIEASLFAYPILLAVCLAFLLVIFIIGWLAANKPVVLSRLKPVRYGIITLMALLIEPDVSAWLRFLTAGNNAGNISLEPELLVSLGLNPNVTSPPDEDLLPGKNLLFIYLESVEQVYLDEERFPGLAPNLQRYQREGLSFSNMIQTQGTTFTAGGIVASQCGTPLLYQPGPNANDILQNGFLENAPCLGDVLSRAGYTQSFLGGAFLDFAGKGKFFEQHQFDRIQGRAELAPQVQPPNYFTGWGLFDDTLFEIARNEFAMLADSGQPFNLTMLTLDTHHPTGQPSKSCEPYPVIDNSILHGVHCTDYLLNEFLTDLGAHPAWENTVVVLFSDHYAMRNDAQQYYPDNSERRLLFTVLNTGSNNLNNDYAVHMDIAPTVLSLLGIQHDTQFLAGRDLTKPFQELTPQILGSSQRLDTIRYVNSTLLTSPAAHICSDTSLIRKQGREILMAQKTTLLSSLGGQLPPDALGTSHALVALLDERGFLSNSLIIPQEDLATTLYSFKQQTFLVVASPAALPAYMPTAALRSTEPLVALLGNLSGSIELLNLVPGEESLDDFTVNTNDCPASLAAVTLDVETDNEFGFMNTLCNAEGIDSAILTPATRTLHLNTVAYLGLYFSSDLMLDADNFLTPVNFIQLPTPLDHATYGYCFPYVEENRLTIPALSISGENPQQLRRLSLPQPDPDELRFGPLEY